MKKELLSPAGNMECLIRAIHAGADAIYVGGKKFGARKFAGNFTEEELEEAIKYCHLYGVKLYVTVNTIIYEDEIDECLSYVEYLHKIGIDAIIVQDIGLITKIKEKFPNMEIHASTQCHNYNEEQFKVMKDLGVTRVVLARELSLEEIKNIRTDLEKEVFIHGALCISYSGQCLFSSIIMGRSGNRGECAGMCRLPYDLINQNNKNIKTQDNYLLSTKELSTINKFKDLMDSDITCFKIEGRMKSPEYVYLTTKIYKTLMNKYYNNEELIINEKDINDLKILFNREFTEGHLFNNKGSDLMNIETPNNIGIKLGKVIKLNNKYITIKLEEDLYQEDGIRFTSNNEGMIINYLYDENDKLINNSKKGTIIKIDNKINLKELTEVRKTSSNKLNKDLMKYEEKKIGINIEVMARLNNHLRITIKDDTNTITKIGNIVEESITSPITEERIKEQLKKLGNTPFISNEILIDMDPNIFISIKELNELRRSLIEELIELRQNNKKEVIINNNNKEYINKNNCNNKTINCLVRNKIQLEACIKNNIDNIYVTNIDLYNEYKFRYNNIYYRIPRIDKKNKKYKDENILITDLSGIEKYKNNKIITDYHLNVVNSSYINYLFKNNVEKVCMSVETNIDKLRKIENINDYNIEILIYGRIELMILNHCILNMLVNKENKICSVCKDQYYLKDRNNKLFPILAENKTNQILNHKKDIYSDKEINELIELGINNYRIDFYEETENDVNQILEKYKNIIQNSNMIC